MQVGHAERLRLRPSLALSRKGLSQSLPAREHQVCQHVVAATIVVVSLLSLSSLFSAVSHPRVVGFVAWPSTGRASTRKELFRQARLERPTLRLALEAEGAEPPQRDFPPNSTELMCRQAADAVMRAYRDGYTRQTVHLRLDAAYDPEDVDGAQYMLKKSLPLAKSFAWKLWNGESLKDIKMSIVDEEVTTLLYREAENPQMDAAVLFLPAREVVASKKFTDFFKQMGDRLVVLTNTEQGMSTFRVENKGRDFYGDTEAGFEVAQIFAKHAYYYASAAINNWRVLVFRSYPSPWEIYIEDVNYQLVKLAESEKRPDDETIIRMTEEYEANNEVKGFQKIGKVLKDRRSSLSGASGKPALAS
eukprot:TRINITY_DN105115_c0_g1_i1.p1 TRINITY_DN105115_c0_g1~~TRINITY_DN105115_c0_g1_i1.p1  ORF type:complete len:373 (+),score=63.85 TRINITY_DN105115_c0_g1_i1:38-1120(+)